MEMVVSQAIQVANCQLVAIRETHGYLKRKAAEYGVILTEQDLHSWSMSAWMELAKAKAWLRMPATRFERRSDKDRKPKTELFPRSEQPTIPARTAELCVQRWPVILELVQSMRNENDGEVA
jgi:hypothetical protein